MKIKMDIAKFTELSTQYEAVVKTIELVQNSYGIDINNRITFLLKNKKIIASKLLTMIDEEIKKEESNNLKKIEQIRKTFQSVDSSEK